MEFQRAKRLARSLTGLYDLAVTAGHLVLDSYDSLVFRYGPWELLKYYARGFSS
jgi:hypothetical protein